MIIKSMSRKVPSFGQLIGYIDREGMPEQYRIRHHLFGWDAEEIRASWYDMKEQGLSGDEDDGENPFDHAVG